MVLKNMRRIYKNIDRKILNLSSFVNVEMDSKVQCEKLIALFLTILVLVSSDPLESHSLFYYNFIIFHYCGPY